MSHGIIKPIDKVLSIKNPEWHGLADVVERIGDDELAPLLFDIIQGNVFTGKGNIRELLNSARLMLAQPAPDTAAISAMLAEIVLAEMPHHQALVADIGKVRPDLVGTEDEQVPLHIPKKAYKPITNKELWEALKVALQDVGAEVTAAGTLEAGKKFFLSVELLGESQTVINGDKFHTNLNFVTSHDGTLAAQAYDSTVRIVCMNTLRASLEAAGEVGFRVFHTSGATMGVANMGELINSILKGRATFRNSMEFLAEQPIDGRGAQEIALGYFLTMQDKNEAAKRSLNAADSIANLFAFGQGNKGRTLYDLLNGATEYWTSGDGTGKKAGASEKAFKAGFGTAADHKNAFHNLLMSGAENLEAVRLKGREALALSLI